MVGTTLTEQEVWEVLRSIPDPEIPVISLVDLGIVTSVVVNGGSVEVTLRPTFSGCPALQQMRSDVEAKLLAQGCSPVIVKVDQGVPWTTDLLNERTRRRLHDFGIAPPPPRGDSLTKALSAPVACPHCGSMDTAVDSPFGSTLCKQIFLCRSCLQPFERFKPL